MPFASGQAPAGRSSPSPIRASQLQEALDSRIVIEQAKGILAERYDIDVEEAFRLRRAARSNRVRIHDVAARVVDLPATPPEFAVVGLTGLPRV